MLILYWTDWFLPSIGGVEVFSARLLPELVRRGHKVTVVAGHHQPGLPDESDWDGVTVRRFYFHPSLAAADLGRIRSLMQDVGRLKGEFKPDVVHLNTLGPSVFFHLQTEVQSRARVLLTMHSPVMDDAVRLDTLYGRALRSAVHINCNSFAVHADLCSRVPEAGSRSSVVYYGMDPPRLRPASRPPGKSGVILALGRMVEDKGFDIAIRAFKIVQQRLPGTRLILVGDGAARMDLEHLVADLGLRGVVQFMGAVPPDQVPAYINSASIVVVPSRWNEPFGLVALEAALMARPVVASRVGGLAEVVEDGSTGVLVERDDVREFANAIIKLLQDDRAADIMSATARRRARTRFSWKRCIDDYERLYTLAATHDQLLEVGT